MLALISTTPFQLKTVFLTGLQWLIVSSWLTNQLRTKIISLWRENRSFKVSQVMEFLSWPWWWWWRTWQDLARVVNLDVNCEEFIAYFMVTEGRLLAMACLSWFLVYSTEVSTAFGMFVVTEGMAWVDPVSLLLMSSKSVNWFQKTRFQVIENGDCHGYYCQLLSTYMHCFQRKVKWPEGAFCWSQSEAGMQPGW